MTETADCPAPFSKPESMPEVKGGITPYLTIAGALKAAEFYTKAFGAEIAAAMPVDDKGRCPHVHLYLNGGSLMLSDPFPEYCGGVVETLGGFNLTLQVNDIDSAFARAVAAGASVAMPVSEMFWGARYGQVRDPFGVLWALNQPL